MIASSRTSCQRRADASMVGPEAGKIVVREARGSGVVPGASREGRRRVAAARGDAAFGSAAAA